LPDPANTSRPPPQKQRSAATCGRPSSPLRQKHRDLPAQRINQLPRTLIIPRKHIGHIPQIGTGHQTRTIRGRTPMQTLILTAFAAFFLALGIERAASAGEPYRAPPHNYYQNNWMNR
jgi:hypothetical protein